MAPALGHSTWCGMRNMAAIIGSGVIDRYRTARRHLERRRLPYWMARLDETRVIKPHSELGHKPSEYATGDATPRA